MMKLTKLQYRESNYINRELTEIVKQRKNAIQLLNGKKPNNNISAKAGLTLGAIMDVIVDTGVNGLMTPKSALTRLLNTDKSNTNRDLKTYGKGYGLIEYAYSNKYNITIVGEEKDIKRETHYFVYITKETLELMKATMEIEGIDWDALIAQIPECERICKELESKTETEIKVINYINDDYLVEKTISIIKNPSANEGHYSEKVNIVNTKDNTVVELDTKENEFTPASDVEEKEVIEEAVEEVSFNEPVEEAVEVEEPVVEETVYRKRLGARKFLNRLQVESEPEIEEDEESVLDSVVLGKTEPVVEEQQESPLDRMARFSAKLNARFEGKQVNTNEWGFEEEEEELDPIEEQRRAWWNK